ncbi:nucleoside-diphosphate-sugar epimerase [Sporomusaceae bacterium BoRhaA]|uniref:NAD-dependent epimerase/dehydratase family protein n=1 Tax=Pelorhabdus rhamnosifermentans TaxID=2772457 RepID=UPI001C06019F|nr:NAD(P)-dependent oxidoreductase [Pelorhabdus rhamnosifermentans]MBU2702848.1 nucleoside-diphosphate-sugar epimerase [Pelorhabdus rhamnosifermentans]
MKILVTGSAGFIAGYLVEELLKRGHSIVGIDNFSKYGPVEKSYDHNPRYLFVRGDVKDIDLMKELIADCDQVVAIAAMIGGITYFHEYAYDLLAENERIAAATFDAAIWAHQQKKLQKINVLSSSMVYESTTVYPSPEGEQLCCPPPLSTYGFQKLACEYFAKGAWEQYKLPYTIIRPFNCVGTGERRAISEKEILSGNVKLAMSHVVPDLVQKVLKGQDPLHILGAGNQIRHYTSGADLAEGIALCVESEKAINEDFNLSTPVSTNVLELAEAIWQKVNGDKPFRYVSDKPFVYDVQKRVPAVEKAKTLLGFEAKSKLSDMLDEVIPWIKEQMKAGNI